jgi:NADPH2:quinone reductase
VVALYHNLELPLPWQGSTSRQPLIIYGGSSAIGAFAIKFARRSNIHPLVVVAGKSRGFVEKLIDRSQGDTIVDYREGEDAVVRNIRSVLDSAGAGPVLHAFDAVSENGSFMTLARVLDPKAHITLVVPWTDYSSLPESLTKSFTWTGVVSTGPLQLNTLKGINYLAQGDGEELGFVFSRLFTRGLQEGWLSGHPFEIVPGGLHGVEKGLANLKAGKANAVKYIYRIGDKENL